MSSTNIASSVAFHFQDTYPIKYVTDHRSFHCTHCIKCFIPIYGEAMIRSSDSITSNSLAASNVHFIFNVQPSELSEITNHKSFTDAAFKCWASIKIFLIRTNRKPDNKNFQLCPFLHCIFSKFHNAFFFI